MKSFVVAIFILSTIVCGLFFSYDFIHSSTRGNMAILQEIYTDSECEDWEGASRNLELLKTKMRKEKFLMDVLVEHSEIDAVMLRIKSVEQYIKRESVVDSMSEVAQAVFLLECFGEKHRFSIANIL